MRRTLAALIVLVLVAAVPVVANANDTAVGGVAGSLTPLASTDIRMESETVQVRMYGGYAAVRVDFRFVNGGEPQTVKLGFPFRVASEQETEDGSPVSPAAGFRAWQDGQPLEVTLESGMDGVEPVDYYVHEVTFPAGATMVSVEYVADPGATVGDPPGTAERPSWDPGPGGYYAWHDYWVHTGAAWAGTIGASVLRFSATSDFNGWDVEGAIEGYAESLDARGDTLGGELSRDYTQPEARVWQWVFRDFEPTPEPDRIYSWSPYDIRLPYYVSAMDERDAPPEYLRTRVADVQASSELVLGEFEYSAFNAALGVSTAWAEGAGGSGAGEWVKVFYGAPREVGEVRILSGYAKRPDLFAKYNRPKTLKLLFSDGTETTVTLADHPGLQRFPVRATAEWVRAEIVDVYRGTTRDETYLSLIDVGSSSEDFMSYEALMAEAVGALPSEEATEPAEETTTSPEPAEEEPAEEPAWFWWVALGAAVVFGGTVGFLLYKRARARKP